ncbi:hypothetical protein Bca4012_054758 [Brassica carinata]
MLLKRHCSSSAELLPHDLVELILEHVPVKPLLKFRSVSRKWKFTIDSQRFKERHLIRRKQLRGPDVLILILSYEYHEPPDYDRRFVFGSSIAWTFKFPITCHMFCYGSCDGLICVFCKFEPSVVANPATGWHRSLPLSNYQHLLIHRDETGLMEFPVARLGFGRDKLRGIYKPVWLYNSSGFVPEVVTHCEVFDFSTNAWRYLVPASPYPINCNHKPVYLDGYLYWFTACEQPMLLSFDLHTETFQVICKAPFAHPCEPHLLTMCILHDRLCVSERKQLTQVIWSFDSSGKTWKTMYSLDLNPISSWWSTDFAVLPIAILDKGQILLQGRAGIDPLVIHDPHTQSYELLLQPERLTGSVYYFESLFSALCN